MGAGGWEVEVEEEEVVVVVGRGRHIRGGSDVIVRVGGEMGSGDV